MSFFIRLRPDLDKKEKTVYTGLTVVKRSDYNKIYEVLNMKRLLIVFISLILVFGVCSCVFDWIAAAAL